MCVGAYMCMLLFSTSIQSQLFKKVGVQKYSICKAYFKHEKSLHGSVFYITFLELFIKAQN